MQRQFLAHFDIFEALRAAALKGLDPKNLILIIVSLNLYIILPYKMAELMPTVLFFPLFTSAQPEDDAIK